jgi:ketosteroid isomerase-like protein
VSPDELARATEAVLAANADFYAALEACDLDAMGEVWEHSDRVSVTHPGWPLLRGWAKVAGSWAAIFANTGFIQFVLTDEQVVVSDATAWITLDENILQTRDGVDLAAAGTELSGARATATNVFVRDGARWKLVLHHSSPVDSS